MLYIGCMTMAEDEKKAVPHWAKDMATTAILWSAALMAASGLGLLLEAIVDTVRFGAPR